MFLYQTVKFELNLLWALDGTRTQAAAHGSVVFFTVWHENALNELNDYGEVTWVSESADEEMSPNCV